MRFISPRLRHASPRCGRDGHCPKRGQKRIANFFGLGDNCGHTMKLGIINSAFQQAGVDTATGLKHISRIGFDCVDIFTEAVGISKKEIALVVALQAVASHDVVGQIAFVEAVEIALWPRALGAVPQAGEVRVDLTTRKVEVTGPAPAADLLRALDAAGYPATVA